MDGGGREDAVVDIVVSSGMEVVELGVVTLVSERSAVTSPLVSLPPHAPASSIAAIAMIVTIVMWVNRVPLVRMILWTDVTGRAVPAVMGERDRGRGTEAPRPRLRVVIASNEAMLSLLGCLSDHGVR